LNILEEYQSKLTSPEKAVRVVKSGDWVDYGSFTGQPVALDKALAARKDELEDVKIRAVTAVRMPEVVKVDPEAKHFVYNNWHFSGLDRKLHDQGVCWYSPILYNELPSYYRRFLDVDVAMIPVAPMDEKGYFKFGGSTVLLFFEENKVRIDPEIIEQTKLGYETYILFGEKIGVQGGSFSG